MISYVLSALGRVDMLYATEFQLGYVCVEQGVSQAPEDDRHTLFARITRRQIETMNEFVRRWPNNPGPYGQ